ncbi:MAG: NTP transferase domain-containing protein [Planctomycetes bacterium]|nr:NTP transferase domain-containing protein [Planctomycetota bacterium]
MKKSAVAVVILAAGKGTRMRSERPKVLFEVAGRPMVNHVLDAALGIRPDRVVVVVGHGAAEVRSAVRGDSLFDGKVVRFALQKEQKGTGHALRCALPALRGFRGTVLVLSGDVPLVGAETLRTLAAAHARSGAAATVLTFRPADPTGYGRVVRDSRGALLDIVEDRDADFETRTIAEVNSGLYAFDAAVLPSTLRRLRSANSQGEFYVTDVPRLLRREGIPVGAVRVLEPEVVSGVNDLSELAAASAVMRRRVLERFLAAGVEIVDPSSTFIAPDASVGAGTRIEPFTVIEGGVRVGRSCSVGPFARLRRGTVLEDGASIGNFVEVKATRVGRGARARHLAYLGDADVGAGANIGAGTITCNYDGRRKHPTVVGEGAFLGSGTLLVAPVTVGRRAVTGAGAVVLAGKGVPAGATAVGVPARIVPGTGRRPARGRR